MCPLTMGVAIESRELRDEVDKCIQGLPVRVAVDQRDLAEMPVFLERLERTRPDVVVLDIANLNEPLAQLVSRIQSAAPDVLIIALHRSSDAESILNAMRAGVQEYLFPPLADTFKRALERKSDERNRKGAGQKQGGKNIALFSAKGGCGATTVACHLAVELGRLNQRVLLADFDLESGIIGFLLKLKPQYSVLDAINNLHRLDLSFWKAIVCNGIPNVEIIPSPPSLALRPHPERNQMQHILGFVRSHYDWTILDLGRSLTRVALSALEGIDEAYLVTTLEIPALHQAKQIVQTLLDSGFGKKRLHLVLNRVPKRLDVTPEELEKMLGVSVFCMLPDDYSELYECYAEGKLLPRSSNVGKGVTRMAAKLVGVQDEKKMKLPFLS